MMLFAIALAAGPSTAEQSSFGAVGSSNRFSQQPAPSLIAAGGGTAANGSRICLGFVDIFIAFILIILILATVIGNVLVVLSVFLYKRMRTFTNFLLTSLATADLLVGLLIMPLALLDLLHSHSWPLGIVVCRIWATFDILLCTASILNLCIISLDRYMAITSPLRYPRTRSRCMACALLCFVWGMSLVVCSPPWFVDEWAIHFQDSKTAMGPAAAVSSSASSLSRVGNKRAKSFVEDSGLHPQPAGAYQCAYPMSVSYRIYSASVSFYIPLVVMLFVYFKIFRVASERERLIREGMGTCRLSRRVEKTQLKGRKRSATTNYHHRSSVPRIREVIQPVYPPPKSATSFHNMEPTEHQNMTSANHCLAGNAPSNATNATAASFSKLPPLSSLNRYSDERTSRTSSGQITANHSPIRREAPEDLDLSCCSEETSCPPSARNSARGVDGTNRAANAAISRAAATGGGNTDSFRRKIKSMECLGSLQRDNNLGTARQSSKYRKSSVEPAAEADERKYSAHNLLPPSRLTMANGSRQQLKKQNSGGGAAANKQQQQQQRGSTAAQFSAKNATLRGSKEKIVYLRERKALKTIGIVVLGQFAY